MLTIENVEVLMLVAALVSLAARRVRLPYTVGLVFAGTILASVGVLQGMELTKELVFKALLPPLIFEAAFFIQWKELKENLVPVLVLATVGVMICAPVVGWFMVQFGGWEWPVALVFGALIAATDPVSVIAMFKELKAEGRLRKLIESESLINDGAAAVLFSIALIQVSGTPLTPGHVAGSLVRQVGGGLAAGVLVGAAVLFFAGRTQEHLVELMFTTIAAFGAFLLAEHFEASGVLAVLVAGLMIGSLGGFGAITVVGRDAVGAFWEFAAFVANSIVFLLIGIRESALGSLLLDNIGLIGIAIVASLVGRAVAVYGVSLPLRWTKHKIVLRHQHILVWGGLRGALSLALAIGLPQSVPFREQVIAVTFGVVAFSVVVQGLTVPILMKRMGVVRPLKPRPEPA